MFKNSVYFRDSCRICTKKDLVNVLKLNSTPPGNSLIKKKDIGKKEQV